MNRKKNRGYQRTHAMIKKCTWDFLQEKDLDRIVIGEICEKALINRSTFYAHFQDIYDVFAQIEEDLEEELLQIYQEADLSSESASIVREYLLVFLKFVAKYRRFYQVLMKDTENPVVKNLIGMLRSQIITPLMRGLSVPDRAASYYFSYVFAGFLSVIRQWLDEKCPESPEELADILFTVMPLHSEEIFRDRFHSENAAPMSRK